MDCRELREPLGERLLKVAGRDAVEAANNELIALRLEVRAAERELAERIQAAQKRLSDAEADRLFADRARSALRTGVGESVLHEVGNLEAAGRHEEAVELLVSQSAMPPAVRLE